MRPKYFGFVGVMILYMSLGLSILAHIADTYITYFKFADIYVKCLEYERNSPHIIFGDSIYYACGPAAAEALYKANRRCGF